jgi:hypothetical protein
MVEYASVWRSPASTFQSSFVQAVQAAHSVDKAAQGVDKAAQAAHGPTLQLPSASTPEVMGLFYTGNGYGQAGTGYTESRVY